MLQLQFLASAQRVDLRSNDGDDNDDSDKISARIARPDVDDGDDVDDGFVRDSLLGVQSVQVRHQRTVTRNGVVLCVRSLTPPRSHSVQVTFCAPST
jgi:hypothetical protein